MFDRMMVRADVSVLAIKELAAMTSAQGAPPIVEKTKALTRYLKSSRAGEWKCKHSPGGRRFILDFTQEFGDIDGGFKQAVDVVFHCGHFILKRG